MIIRRKKKLPADEDSDLAFKSSLDDDEMPPAVSDKPKALRDVKLFCDKKSDDSESSTTTSSSTDGSSSKHTTLRRYAKQKSDTSGYLSKLLHNRHSSF